MLMLPCVLGEFRTMERGDEAAKQIIGLPAARQRMGNGWAGSSGPWNLGIFWRKLCESVSLCELIEF
jgi:hypothetical protein